MNTPNVQGGRHDEKQSKARIQQLNSRGFWLYVCVFAVLVAWATTVVFIPRAKAISPPAIITYQGKLLQNGAAVTTTQSMSFVIFDAATNGNAVYSASGTYPGSLGTISVTPNQGIFSVDLGNTGTSILTTSTFANEGHLYLEVWVGGQRLSPRRLLTASPFAINSQYLMGFMAATSNTTQYVALSDTHGNFAYKGIAQSADVSGGILYINPPSATSTFTMFGVAVNNAERFRVDASGNVWALGNMTVTGTLQTVSTTTVPDLIATNSITLNGDTRTAWPSASGGSPWVTSTGLAYLSPTTTAVIIGSNGTSTANSIFEVSGNTVFSSGTFSFRNGLTQIDGRIRKPTQAARLSAGGSGPALNGAQDVVTQGNYAYVTDTASSTLEIIDISDPTRPRHAGLIANGTNGARLGTPMGLAVQGGYAYVAASSSGALEIVDVTDPTNPTHVSSITTSASSTALSGPQDVAVQGNYAFVLHKTTTGLNSALDIIDISDPKNPKNISQYVGALSDPKSVVLSGKYAYIVNTSNGLTIIDLSDIGNPIMVGQLIGGSLVGARDVFVAGKYAYVTTGTVPTLSAGGLAIIDISSSTNPTVAGQSNSFGATAVRVLGNYAYVTDNGVISGTSDGFSIIDISSSTAPTRVVTTTFSNSSADFPALFGDPASLAIQGNYMYITLPTSHVLEVVDISGSAITNADIGGAKVGNLQVMNGALFDNGVSVRGGLSIGNQGLLLSGDFGMSLPTSSNAISVTNTLRFSHTTLFETNATGTDDLAFVFRTRNQWASSTSKYLLSIRNNDNRLFSVATNGDASVAGNLSASSTSIGTPGAPGDLAERVDVDPAAALEPGDVVVVAQAGTDLYTKSTGAYAATVAGVISTNASIVVGNGRTAFTAPLAMVGRVPVKISNEAGAIHPGDMLVTASRPGYAMRYDAAHASGTPAIVGVALDTFDGVNETSTMLILVRGGWAAPTTQSQAPTELTVEHSDNSLEHLAPADMDLGGFALLNVGRIVAAHSAWEITASGQLVSHVQTPNGQVDLYTIQTDGPTVLVSGSGQLANGTATVSFDDRLSGVIDMNQPLRISVSLTSPAGSVYVTDKSSHGFTVREVDGRTDSATFDWLLIGTRGQTNSVPEANAPETPPEAPPVTDATTSTEETIVVGTSSGTSEVIEPAPTTTPDAPVVATDTLPTDGT